MNKKIKISLIILYHKVVIKNNIFYQKGSTMAREALAKRKQPVAPDNCILITVPDFAGRIRSGKYTARKIAKAANALVTVGRNIYVYVPKVEKYLESLAGD